MANLAGAGLQIELANTYTLSNVREAYAEARHQKRIGKSIIVLD